MFDRRVVVTARGLRDDVQYAVGDPVGEHETPDQLGALAGPFEQQALGRSGDLQSGGRAVALVQLLARRRGEHHRELKLTGPTSVDGRFTCCEEPATSCAVTPG